MNNLETNEKLNNLLREHIQNEAVRAFVMVEVGEIIDQAVQSEREKRKEEKCETAKLNYEAGRLAERNRVVGIMRDLRGKANLIENDDWKEISMCLYDGVCDLEKELTQKQIKELSPKEGKE
jgi:hypothetical protein